MDFQQFTIEMPICKQGSETELYKDSRIFNFFTWRINTKDSSTDEWDDRFDMDVSENSGTPKSSILIGFFIFSPSILGYPYFWKRPYMCFLLCLAPNHTVDSMTQTTSCHLPCTQLSAGQIAKPRGLLGFSTDAM